MKKVLAALAIIVLVAGCHKSSGQLPPTAPPLPTCPAPGNAAYTPLNPSGTASLSFTATGVTSTDLFRRAGRSRFAERRMVERSRAYGRRRDEQRESDRYLHRPVSEPAESYLHGRQVGV